MRRAALVLLVPLVASALLECGGPKGNASASDADGDAGDDGAFGYMGDEWLGDAMDDPANASPGLAALTPSIASVVYTMSNWADAGYTPVTVDSGAHARALYEATITSSASINHPCPKAAADIDLSFRSSTGSEVVAAVIDSCDIITVGQSQYGVVGADDCFWNAFMSVFGVDPGPYR